MKKDNLSSASFRREIYKLRVSAVGYKTQEKRGDGEQGLYGRYTFPDGRGKFHDR